MPLTPTEHSQLLALLAKSPRLRLLNSVLRSLSHSAAPEKTVLVYNQALRCHPAPHDHLTFTYTLTALSRCAPSAPTRTRLKGAEIHARLAKSGLSADPFVQNSLLNLYSASGDVASAQRVFSEVARPDVVSWTSMVWGLARNGRESDALAAFATMDGGVRPNAVTLVAVLPACSCPGVPFNLGRSVHAYILRNQIGGCGGGGGGQDSNIILNNAVLNMYMTCRNPRAARHLFDGMRARDTVTWTTMISGYARSGCCEEAIMLFHSMVRDPRTSMPNEATLVSILSVCASAGALSTGKWVHSYMSKKNIASVDGPVGNALVNMYAKCGDVGMALRVFDSLLCKDLVSWTAIIGGMALVGHARGALELFASMLCHGVRPDHVAFLAVLTACCYSGLVSQGRIFFEAMSGVYGIVPGVEHFTCMVDMLGRAGLLEEAERLVRGMPMEPDKHVWGALFSACKAHGDKERFEMLLRHSIESGTVMEGESLYALASNVYAELGGWDRSIKLKELMRTRGAKKTLGCSWIDVSC